jgi:Cu-Zn family superoxide dismutase
MSKAAFFAFSSLALSFVSAGCATYSGPTAQATLQPTRGNAVSGALQFRQTASGLRVTGEVRGLTPGQEVGFHVHEKGDCSSGDGMSAGGHFNPGGLAHGRHGAAVHHAGDLPSLKADASGVARIDFETRSIALGGATDIVGKGLIVHRDPDDYTTQPTGNAGPRLACAVIAQK